MKRFVLLLLAALLIAAQSALAELPCSYYDAYGDHDWQQIDFSYPTCTDDGYVKLECATCHKTDTIVQPAYGHSWEDTGGKAPTCTAEGWRVQQCVNCGETRNVPVAKLEHNWVKAGYEYPSTCVDKGWRMEECTNCGATRDIELPLIDHQFGPWYEIEPATDHSAGTRGRNCTMCGVQETHYYYMDGTLYRGGPSGVEVAKLQQMLIDLHYLNDRADGSFGKKTEQAVMQYQQFAGIEPSGVAYPQTIARLTADWNARPGNAPFVAPTPAPTAIGTHPYCVRTEDIETVRVDFCAVHGALYEQERSLIEAAQSDEEMLAALRQSVSLWLEAVDELYSQWEGQLAEADKPRALEARNAFAAMLTAQEAALSSVYGEDSPEALRFELELLHEQATTICGYLNMAAEG